jgi:hypothetical protein
MTQEREEFEKHVKQSKYLIAIFDRDGEIYICKEVQDLWNFYQAATAKAEEGKHER